MMTEDLSAMGGAWAGRKALVTGASGFIGSHLVRGLVHAGCEVGALMRRQSDQTRIHDVLPRIRPLTADLLDAEGLQAVVKAFQPSVVFHLAAYGVNSWTCDAGQAMLTNAIGTANVLEACRDLTLDAFVYAGTCFEYAGGTARCREDAWPAPVNAYAASKTAGWVLAQFYERAHDIPVVGVRPFQVYGPQEAPNRLVPSVILSALRGQDVRVSEGKQVRDFIFVEDVVAGFMRAAACRQARGAIVNLGTGQGVAVRAVIEKLIEVLGTPVPVMYGAVAYRP